MKDQDVLGSNLRLVSLMRVILEINNLQSDTLSLAKCQEASLVPLSQI